MSVYSSKGPETGEKLLKEDYAKQQQGKVQLWKVYARE